jgi:hypothetical protein
MDVPQDQIDRAVTEGFIKTLFARKRDIPHDPLPYTEIGKHLEALQAELTKASIASEMIRSATTDIRVSLRSYSQMADSIVRSASEALNEIEHLSSETASPEKESREKMLIALSYGAFSVRELNAGSQSSLLLDVREYGRLVLFSDRLVSR